MKTIELFGTALPDTGGPSGTTEPGAGEVLKAHQNTYTRDPTEHFQRSLQAPRSDPEAAG